MKMYEQVESAYNFTIYLIIPILILSFFVPQVLPTPFVYASVYVIFSCCIIPSELRKQEIRHHL